MEMTTVYLRNFPKDLHKRTKAAAAMAGISMKDFIIMALEKQLKEKGGA